MKTSKSEFFKEKIKFWDYIVDKYTIKPNTDKLAAVKEFPILVNIKKHQSF